MLSKKKQWARQLAVKTEKVKQEPASSHLHSSITELLV